LESRTFTDIVQNLKMNPNTFKFHSEILINNGLLEKHGRGTYQTTDLGKLLLELTNRASLAALKTVQGEPAR
jgi:predicted transcriptional regulator